MILLSDMDAEKHKRDSYCDPIWRADAWQLQHLHEAADFCKEWHQRFSKSSLTPQTTLAMHQTLHAVADPAAHLIADKAFSYVLLGKCSSDPIEARFGWYRQLSGANLRYVGRSIARQRHCESCKLVPVSGDVISHDVSHTPAATIISAVNRGGLSAPSDICFATCALAYLFFVQLNSRTIGSFTVLDLTVVRLAADGRWLCHLMDSRTQVARLVALVCY